MTQILRPGGDGLVELRMRLSPDLARNILTERQQLEMVLAEQQRMVVALVSLMGGSAEIPVEAIQGANPNRLIILRKSDGSAVRIEVEPLEVDKLEEKRLEEVADGVPRETPTEPGAVR